ncbi:MAG TPA: hypothetical protein VHL80_11105 [Polyangia bacterium]|nr:hypothetical protein [Polyangia bacterium]
MITDPPPRGERKRAEYDRSDAIVTMPLPPAEVIQPRALAIKAAMEGGEIEPVAYACADLLAALSAFYAVSTPPVAVLGVRPHKVQEGITTYQLFGDYTPSTEKIRVWMRTAIRGRVSSPKALLNTLLHEFCHHLDCTRLKCPESYHTRGFYWRIDHLYHLALATPPERRRPLRWIRRGGVWAIDWTKLRGS